MVSRVATRQTAQPQRANHQRTPSTRSTNAPVSLRPGIGGLQRSFREPGGISSPTRRCQERSEEEKQQKKAGGPRGAGSEAQEADQNAVPADLEDEKKNQPMLVRRGGRLVQPKTERRWPRTSISGSRAGSSGSRAATSATWCSTPRFVLPATTARSRSPIC